MHSLSENPISYERDYSDSLKLLASSNSVELTKDISESFDKANGCIIFVLNNYSFSTPDNYHDEKLFWETLKTTREEWFWEIKSPIHLEFINWISLLNIAAKEILKEESPINIDNISTNGKEVFFGLFGLLNKNVQNAFFKALNTRIETAIQKAVNKKYETYRKAVVVFVANGTGGLVLYEFLKSKRTVASNASWDVLSESKPVSNSFFIQASKTNASLNKKQEIEELVTYSSQISRSLNLNSRPKVFDHIVQKTEEFTEKPLSFNGFNIGAIFLLSCPLSKHILLSENAELWLPYKTKVYNIFHSDDLGSSRLEPLYYPSATILPSSVILPNHKNNMIINRAVKLSKLETATARLARTFKLSVEEDERINVYKLPIHADIRYGTHSRKPKLASLNMKGQTKRAERRVTRLNTLMDVMNISSSKDKEYIVKQLVSGHHSNLVESKLPSNINLDDVDIVNEGESNSGLELPVRLDFETTDPDIVYSDMYIYNKSYNYWNSKDIALFILKRVTNFQPQITYSDFLRVAAYSETLQSQNG